MSFDRIVHAFAGNPLDRIGEKRSNDAQMRQLLADPMTRIAVFAGDRPLITIDEDARRMDVLWLPANEALAHINPEQPVILLGLTADRQPRFACQLTGDADGMASEAFAQRGKFIDLRSLGIQGMLDPAELGMLAQARALTAWHDRHLFCAVCGAPTKSADAGYKRVCPSCQAEHFPRTDPVAIMVVHHGTDILLGRQRHFPQGTYSALAGFVEPGESIEEAARREIFEESGVRVGKVTYHSSQPWPFTSNLMIGLIGEALGRDLDVDLEELEDARWFSRHDVSAMQNRTHPDGLATPPEISIAHQLIRGFLANPKN